MTLDQQIALMKNEAEEVEADELFELAANFREVVASLEQLKAIKAVSPEGGAPLSLKEASQALREAMELIEHIGYVSVNYKSQEASAWMKKYFPSYAD